MLANMKTFKISKKTNEIPTSTVPLAFNEIVTSGSDLCLIIQKDKALELTVGGKLHFEKLAKGSSDQFLKVCEEDVEIKDIVDSGNTRYVYFEYVYIQPLTLFSFKNISSSDGYKYKLYFSSEHHMLPCDISNADGQCNGGNGRAYTIYIRRGGNIIEFRNLAFSYPNEVKIGCDITFDGGSCTVANSKSFNYETMERNSILAKERGVTSGVDFTPQPGDQVLFSTNPYFYTDTNGKVHLYPRNSNCNEVVNVCKYVDFMGLGVVLEQDYDAKRMFQEYQVNELYVNKIKNSIVPDFIDLEKIKYAPAFYERVVGQEAETTGTTLYLATGLTFNLHFRTRISGSTDELEEDVAKYTFEDTWHFNDAMSTWNGMSVDDPPKEREDLYSDEEFTNSSNLIGFLGFTDDDVYNQKNRLKKTFIRLSFYDDVNPLTQNLLYYSTIFFDSGDLFGKYVKRKAWLEDNDEFYDQLTNPVVWSSACTEVPCSAVTSQLTVNDEYDMTKSGEGFNIYLFRQDAPTENYPQNIYMKVEFNHAGIGRTVPMIYWRKDGNVARRLTVNDYITQDLYIPIQIRLTERGYVYTFPDAIQVDEQDPGTKRNGILWENERLIFNLFEPMIEADVPEEENEQP